VATWGRSYKSRLQFNDISGSFQAGPRSASSSPCSQFRPDHSPPPAVPCMSTQSCRSSSRVVSHRHRVWPLVCGSNRSPHHRTSEQLPGTESMSYQTCQQSLLLWSRVLFRTSEQMLGTERVSYQNSQLSLFLRSRVLFYVPYGE